MKDDRLRVPVEPAYISALGLAVYAFARLEWAAICWCERIQPNSIHGLKQLKTAGVVARKLIELTATLPPSSEQVELSAAADAFRELAERRNELLHVQPGSLDDKRQRLFRDGVPWGIAEINDAADDFTECNDRLV